ncbi:hypothetical protein KFZ68_15730 [Photobacterium damselae]|uniref:hypothetical protein n=1 Tax=Photobacterium damselae TaxID=38293 RepID=UPI0025439F67
MHSSSISSPWDFEPMLRKSDIDIVMQQLTKACFELKDSVNTKYDDQWTIGTRKYGWALKAIERMALSNKFSFISIYKGGLGQVFKINSVPVRLVTDNFDNPKKHHRYIPSEDEQNQLPLFNDDLLPKALVWRLILDLKVSSQGISDFDSQPKLKLIGLNGSSIIASYIYDEILVPVVINNVDPRQATTSQPTIYVEQLPEASKAKPVKLVRRIRSNEEKKSKGQ